MSYFKFKKRESKTTDRQKLVQKVDTIHSEYIRIRDADENGIVTCITCSDKQHWTDVDCGHYVKRGNMATRWHLQNSGGQCRLCNSAPDGKEDDHAKAIDLLYGPGTADMLVKLGMYQELKKEVKALKEEKFKGNYILINP